MLEIRARSGQGTAMLYFPVPLDHAEIVAQSEDIIFLSWLCDHLQGSYCAYVL